MSLLEKLFGKKQPVTIKKAVATPSVIKSEDFFKVAAKKAPVKKSLLSKKK